MTKVIKQHKTLVVCIVLGIILIIYKMYTSQEEFIDINNNENIQIKEEKKEEEAVVIVHITGEVKNPGLKKLKDGSRIEDAINAAGGLTEEADLTNINLAQILEDGTKIKIPNIKNTEKEDEQITEEILINSNSNKPSKLININTATKNELESLPGIGESIATQIIEYRAKNGRFKKIEEIKNVTGIGESKYNKIKDYIKIN